MKNIVLFFLLAPITANAQCDSVAVREWLRTMNHDTVCFSFLLTCNTVGFQSRITNGIDSSDFVYDYTDSVSARTSRKIYYNYRLSEYGYETPGDTVVTIVYDRGNCEPSIVVKVLENDSLSPVGEKEMPFYDYYSEVVYDTLGNIDASWIETIVVKHGKKFRRTVYTRPKRKFCKTRIRMKRIRL